MTTFITTFGAAFMLGLVFSAAPGPIFAESIRRGLTGGFDEALRVQLGSLVGDATWAILGLAGVGILLQTDMLKIPIGLAGAGYLGWLAWDSWREAATSGQPPAEPLEDAQKSEGAQESGTKVSGGAFRSGMVLSLSNPQNVAFWAALGSAFGSLGIDTPRTMDYSVFFAGFMVASVAWCYFCAAAISRLFGGRNAAWHVWTYRICALAFSYLACGTALEALRLLLG
ncbi:MAG: chemotaxis protein [Rhodospirillaceae bacterium]|nr:chemotaxis protein [Rhodospirillaceae bacterium]